MPVPLLDLHRQYATIKSEMDRAVLAVLEHGSSFSALKSTVWSRRSPRSAV